ncbi:MAG: hypothetical protein MJZ14_09660 [Paludibacteraceae bacterium]|nr:hypothetical protein [Paludibacteraceae bacterium]
MKSVFKLIFLFPLLLLLNGCGKGGNVPVNTHDKTHGLVDVMQHRLPLNMGEMGSCDQIVFEDHDLVMELNLLTAIGSADDAQVKSLFAPLLMTEKFRPFVSSVATDGYGLVFRFKGFNKQVDLRYDNEELKHLLERQPLSQDVFLSRFVSQINDDLSQAENEDFSISLLDKKEGVHIVYDVKDTKEEPLELDLDSSEEAREKFFEGFFSDLLNTGDRTFISLCRFIVKAKKALAIEYNGTESGVHFELQCSAEDLHQLYMLYLNDDYPLYER